jgi:HPt (histidine-containing phosphotransfer) domain-containing protein
MKEMFLEKGFSDYLSKPIEIAKLDDMMSRWIPVEKQIKGGRVRRESFRGESGIVISGVDTRKGIAMTGGTEAGYRKVLAQFYKDVAERLPVFSAIPVEEELATFAAQAHAIKSAAGTIGAEEVSVEAAALEAAGKAGDTKTIRETLPGFCEDLARLTGGIEKVLEEKTGCLKKGEGAAEVSPASSSPALYPVLSSLRSAIETKNMKEIDSLLEEIEQLSLDTETRELINGISDKVLMGEYQGAIETINILLIERH